MKAFKRDYKYLSVYSIPLFAIASFLAPDWWSFLLPLLVFVLVPLREIFTPNDTSNYSKNDEERVLADKFYDRLLYALVPIQYAIVFYGLFILTNNNQDWSNIEIAGKVFSIGICCGIIGINVGHELGHRSNKNEQLMAKALLLSSMYMHFYIEHNRGHHKNVATKLDPATAQKGEIVYFFWFKSMILGYISAWKLEMKKLRKLSLPFLSFRNEMIHFTVIQVLFVAIIYLIFGWNGAIYFLSAALIGILMLETVNYIEHYGLERKMKENGKYERVLPTHSWNSNHEEGRKFLFELSRHSDHHYLARRKYQVLRHFDHSPQMPTGYPGMMVIALVPPLWFYVMNKTIAKHQQLLKSQPKSTANISAN